MVNRVDRSPFSVSAKEWPPLMKRLPLTPESQGIRKNVRSDGGRTEKREGGEMLPVVRIGESSRVRSESGPSASWEK